MYKYRKYIFSMQLRIKEEIPLAMTKLKEQLLLDSYDDVIWHFIEPFFAFV